MEHVENPIETALKIASKVSEGGLVIFAHCYWPVIINIEVDRFVFDNFFGGKYQRFPHNWLILPYRVFNYIFRKIITR